MTFSFEDVLRSIPRNQGHLAEIAATVDQLPPLLNASFDIFGEIYESAGDDASKKAFGEFFTGRHIIDGLLPVFFARAEITGASDLRNKTISDVACGTGGFLSGVAHHARSTLGLNADDLRSFVSTSLSGYDLNHSSASRARANVFLAAGVSAAIRGGIDSLNPDVQGGPPLDAHDVILTNPPYGASTLHHRRHERFLARVIDLLRPGTGWGFVILPASTFENPSSSAARFELLRRATVTDVIALPQHAFAPYAVQRTAALIFRRREHVLAADSWSELTDQVGDELVNLFIVDHDGFANNEKRFPTRRQRADGSWVHDDLARWVDDGGVLRASVLENALIHGRASRRSAQQARMSLNEMRQEVASRGARRDTGVELFPDTYLRRSRLTASAHDFAQSVWNLEQSLFRGEGRPLEPEVRRLLNTAITFTDPTVHQIGHLFSFHPGTRALTEAAMYNAFAVDGIAVYGEGVGVSAHRITRNALSGEGRPVQVFEGPALSVALNGTSGLIQTVRSEPFACNQHAGALIPSASNVDLEVVAQQAEADLRELASNRSGSSSLAQGIILSLRVELPSDDAERALVRDARLRLERLRRVCAR